MTESKPLRADARRNRARVLEAAESVFAARGTGAPTEEVARAAGVGVGTVFRHFPTKEELLKAVLFARLLRFADEADAVVAANSPDPGDAFFGFLAGWIEMAGAKNAYLEALSAAGIAVPTSGSVIGERLIGSLGVLLGRAQDAGAARKDLSAEELIPVIIGMAKGAEHVGDDPVRRARTIEIMFDALRPPGRSLAE
ncbi:TetR/AcrR family transcriptional regulator [Amycolatopsis sp. H20-H5]|uniref:TetR/AcrR family transcriptional regulator n=1 Tax=Amycolatopsis sp. H20-H5 TaxID=3046309 RepID=UPI002DBC193D|nr:helix-turn-helix domain-containing protein [Amycolatopsis sp. H20-H5]MEC3976821.1 helix-turn-helix domain-containing protein [Amycolatopsis sp. H20-H5]